MTNLTIDSSELFVPFENRNEREQKISLESRKRIQAYSLMDFFLSSNTYFDFFSLDLFEFVQQAKILANELEDNSVCLEHFLYLMISPRKAENLELTSILNSYGMNLKSVSETSKQFSSINQSVDNSVLLKFSQWLKKKTRAKYHKAMELLATADSSEYFYNNFFFFEKKIKNNNIRFSSSVWKLFEKATENAGYRFKTAVVTPEIFFVTLMELKQKRIAKIIKTFVPNEIDWLVLRFKLIKRIYYHESLIRQKIQCEYRSFAYLYKRTIPEISFDQFLTREDYRLQEIIVTFRNNLIADFLSYSISDYIETEIISTLRSIKKLKELRSYSF